jgi:outer membrane protein assembly factor BamD
MNAFFFIKNRIKQNKLGSLWFLAIFFAFLVNGCAEKKVDESDPSQLFREAEEDVKNDHYQIAIEKFRSIRNKFPYSKSAVDAQLRIADVYFLQDAFPEAAVSYESFMELHPKHEKVPYAMFRVGKSYFNDTPSNVARDLVSAQRALDAYGDFLHKFPADPYVEDAKKDINTLRNSLAEKEVYVGDFYFKNKNYNSAIERYNKAIRLYPETTAGQLAKTKLDETKKNHQKEDSN